WAIVLTEFMHCINEYSGREIGESEYDLILKNTIKGVKKVFPLTGAKVIRNDIRTILDSFIAIARGEEPAEDIGFLTLGEYAPYMRAPHRMDLMVSAMTKDGMWHCNQRCIHCYAAGQKLAEEKELSKEDWKKVLDKCREACIPQVTFTGGEPTMREDLIELIDYAKWFVTRLNTNGIKLTKEYCEKLFKASLDSVQITFYSADAETHNFLVGAKEYENTVAGIKNALEAGLSVSINTPLCTKNADYVKTLEFLHGLGVRYVTCSGLITTGNAAGEQSESLQLGKEEITRILKDAAAYCFANGMEIAFTSPGWIDESVFKELGINTPSCGACLSNMAITPAGKVVPCQSWLSGDDLGSMVLGEWDTIWNEEKCRERREYSAKMEGKCPLRRSHE
ncbi:MAG: radical SAM protein, partial [Lachnospiraceae bacterium]|nr:radical SAM protein [Lachnospiraceae bacterium]